MRKTKYKHTFDTLVINNRWRTPIWSRSSDWVIFGLRTRYFSPTEYEYSLCLFGIDFRLWFKRELIPNKDSKMT